MQSLRPTWSRIGLRETLHHRTTGQTGQNHGCHDLVHLHRLWAAEATRETHTRNTFITLHKNIIAIVLAMLAIVCRSPVGRLSITEVHRGPHRQVAPACGPDQSTLRDTFFSLCVHLQRRNNKERLRTNSQYILTT